MSADADGSMRRIGVLVRPGETYEGKQGLTYGTGVYAETTGASRLCMHSLTIPPGGRAKAHVHAGHETAIYLVSGEVDVWHGEGFTERTPMQPGDFFYIPAGVPHLPVNASQTESAFAVVARTDPNEQESVELRPDLDALAG
ncbi:MAG: cupin domain-containing protein [Chloroflexota bacterium]